jgi:hypothetical protein
MADNATGRAPAGSGDLAARIAAERARRVAVRARMEANGTLARIREEVAAWPPLTDAQRADLAALLGGRNARDS